MDLDRVFSLFCRLDILELLVAAAAVTVGGYSYMVQASDGLGGVWQMIMGQALVPVSAVWPTILTYSLAGGAIVGGLGSMFSIRKHLNV